LTQEQVACLVEFLNTPSADPSAYFSKVDPGPNPVLYSIVSSADASAGESYYNTNCASCHGDPSGASPVGSPEGGILAYLDGDGKFSEFAHKVRWGIPNTTMTRASMGSPDATDVADMMLWLQQAGGSGFVINPGLSGNWWGGLPRSGEGFLIDVAINFNGDTILVVSFYTYDSIGNQVWLIGNAPVNSNTAEIALLIPEGAKWGAAYNPDDSDEIPWGTGTFTFTSCGAGHIALVPNEVMLNNGFTSLEYDIKRDILTPGIECPTPTK
jgi:cytochrome c2